MSKKAIRICAVLLILLMCLSLLPMAAWAEEGEEEGHTHDYSETFTIDVEPACTTEGSKSRHCTVDGCTEKTEVTTIPALGHNFADGVCTRCGVADPNYKPALTGTVTIAGNTTAGSTLTATVSGSNVSSGFLYEWFQGENSTGPASANNTHFVTPGDEGKSVRCEVTCEGATGKLTSNSIFIPAVTRYTLSVTYNSDGGAVAITSGNHTSTMFTGSEVDLEEGTSITLTITPTDGYEVEDVKVNNASIGAVTSCLLTMDANKAVEVSFKEKVATPYALSASVSGQGTVTYQIAVEGGASGSLAGSAINVPSGTTVNLTFTPGTGYEVKSVTVGSENKGAVTSCAVTVTQNTRVTVIFEKTAEKDTDSSSYTVEYGAVTDNKDGTYTYGVTVKDASGAVVHDTDGNVEFLLRYPTGMTATSHTYSVKHKDDGAAVTIVSLTDSGVQCSYNHFSDFVLTATPKSTDAPAAPKTPTLGRNIISSTPGQIKGVDTTMEYATSPDATSWTACTGSTISVTKPGTYYIRYKATADAPASKATAVSVMRYYRIKAATYPSNRGTISVGKVYDANAAVTTYRPSKDSEGYYVVPEGFSVQFVITPSRNYQPARVVTGTDTTIKDVRYDGEFRAFTALQVKADASYTVVMQYIGSSPRTGDNANLPLWTELGAASLVLLAAAVVFMKKKNVF